MKISSLINTNGNPQKEVAIISFKDGTEILTHYGTPIAGRINKQFVKTEHFHSVTTSKNINLYLQGVEAKTVPQLTLDTLLNEK